MLLADTPSTRVRTVSTLASTSLSTAPRIVLAALATAVALVTALLQGAFSAPADAATAGPPLSYLSRVALADGFNRVVSSGWGHAPIGGTYRGAGSSGTTRAFASNGYVTNVRAGHSRVQTASISSRDMLVNSSVALSSMPRSGNWGAYLALELREHADGSAYTATLHLTPGGHARLQIDRHPADGTAHTLTSRSLGALRSGRGYYFQAAVVGNRIWARVYHIGSRASSWLTTADTSSSAVTGDGTTGVVIATVGSSRAVAGAHFGSLKVTVPQRSASDGDPTPAPSAPAPAPSTSTPAPAPSTSTPPPAPAGPRHAAYVLSAAGSAPIGSTHYAVPAGAVFVATTGDDGTGNGSQTAPFQTLSRALQATPGGGTVVMRGGIYHATTIADHSVNATVQPYPGEAVWFDGSVPVTGWTQNGNVWVHSGWTATFDHSASYTSGSEYGGFVNANHPVAAWPDMVFVDGAPLQQVAANPAAGEFAVNYDTQQIIVGSDPTGHDVRASDKAQAFIVGGTLNLRGIGVRNYAASLPDQGMIFLGPTAGATTFENDVFQNSATTALTSNSKHITFDHVTARDNGMTGLAVNYADGGVIENCLFDGNNIEHFNREPDSAGLKVERTNGVVIKDNVAENGLDNFGIWTDENVTNFSITGNVVRNNGAAVGIQNELSGTGIVANNAISGSTYGYTAMDSGNITVANNDLSDNGVWDIGLSQDNRWEPGMGTAGPSVQPSAANPWLVQNIAVLNNNFGRKARHGFQFYVLDKDTNRPASSMNLSIQGNMFAPCDSSDMPYAIGWGMADNDTVHMYSTPAAFAAGEKYSWQNSIAPSGTGLALPTSAAVAAAMPLTAAIASAIAQTAGTRGVGTF